MLEKHLCLGILSLAAIPSCVVPRPGGSDLPIGDVLERVVEDESQEGVLSNLPEVLDEMQEAPLDINSASVLELQQLPGISPILAHQIYEFRKERLIKRLDDLMGIEGFDRSQMEMIRPFVTSGHTHVRDDQSHLSITSRSRLIASPSADNVARFGQLTWPDVKVQQKVVVTLGGREAGRDQGPALILGMVTEKDQGETDVLDFVSGSLQYKVPSMPIRLILGDFAVACAQGVIFSGARGTGKGSEVIGNTGRKGRGVRVSLASEMPSFLRGVAGAFESRTLSCSVFCSRRFLDADVDSSGVIVSLPRTGLHRSEEEQRRKNAAAEFLVGGRLDAELGFGFELGVSSYRSSLDHDVRLSGPWGFKGKSNSALGLDITFVGDAVSAFGELGRDHAGALSGIAGFTVDFKNGFSASVIARSYNPRFFNMHGSAFGEGGAMPSNESGVFSGVKCDVAPWLRLSLFYDQFSFPWRRSTSSLPSNGNEFVVTCVLRPLKVIDCEIRYRCKQKVLDQTTVTASGLSERAQGERDHQAIRCVITVGRSLPVVWKSRVEIVKVSSPLIRRSDNGVMIFQEITGKPCDGLRLVVRGAAFETSSFESALYVYETELPGTYLTPALYGRGFRWFVAAQYDLTSSLHLSAKVSQTRLSPSRGQIAPLRLSVQLDLRL